MAQPFKYVLGLALDDINNRRLEAIVFARTLTHKDAAELFAFGDNVVGAGFGTLDTKDGKLVVHLHGMSESLNIGPSDMDQRYVEKALGLVPNDEFGRDRQQQAADYSKGLEIVQGRRKPAQPRTRYRR